MPFGDPAHHSQIAARHRPRRTIDAAAAEAETLRLAQDRKFVLAVDHFFRRQQSRFAARTGKKPFSSDCGDRRLCLGFIAENTRLSVKAGLWFRRGRLVMFYGI